MSWTVTTGQPSMWMQFALALCDGKTDPAEIRAIVLACCMAEEASASGPASAPDGPGRRDASHSPGSPADPPTPDDIEVLSAGDLVALIQLLGDTP